jgi:UDP-N-acetylglucosamine:LPS N-acetylglucosamine transferase
MKDGDNEMAGSEKANKKRISLVSGTGGHLTELLQLSKLYKRYDYYFVTPNNQFSRQMLKEEKVQHVALTLRRPLYYLLNLFQSLMILLRKKPDVVITTGSGDALATCILARLMGKNLIFIETVARVQGPSNFGRIMHIFSDLTIVQWKTLLDKYEGSVFGGLLFSVSPSSAPPRDIKNVFVTVGTQTLGFDRLLKAVDDLAGKGLLKGTINAQIGYSGYEPRNIGWFRFDDYDRYLKLVEESDLVITHDGGASIGTALGFGKATIVVPRLKEHGEIIFHSDFELARAMAGEGLIILVENVDDLWKAIEKSRDFGYKSIKVETETVDILDDYLAKIRD